MGLTIRTLIPGARNWRFSSPKRPAGCGAHLAFYSMGTGILSRG